MITLDKTCRDIMLQDLSKNNNLSCNADYKRQAISKVERYTKLNEELDGILVQDFNADTIATILSSQIYFKFKPYSQLEKLESEESGFLIAPLIVRRFDAEGNTHFLCTVSPQKGDVVIQRFALDPFALQRLYELLEEKKYVSAIIVLGSKESPVQGIVFGKNAEACKALQNKLKEYKL